MAETRNGIPQPENAETESTSLLAFEATPYTPSARPTSGRSYSTPDILESINNVGRRARSSTVSSVLSTSVELVTGHFDKKKFSYLLAISISIYLAFVAAFAPRTSLARDFRRWHNSRFTTSEVYRIYLDTVQEDSFIHNHMKQYANSESRMESFNYTIQELRRWGFEPKFETYYPWVTIPEKTAVELLNNGTYIYNASLTEDYVIRDFDKTNQKVFRNGYHAYSPNAEVRNSYVYCNYGTLEDYKILLDNNIKIEGKTHILRDGVVSTGIKVKNAELYGASSVLVYNDPSDDGFVTEANGFKSYPNGPARNPSSIKRDSVEYMFEFPGDPTTPNFPSKNRELERLSPAGKIPRIPSVPISVKDVRPLLLKLNGKGIKVSAGGDVEGFDYSSGPSDENIEVNIINRQAQSVVEIHDIIVEIPGIFSNGDIIIASHRDSWVSPGGAANPSSGSAILLEIARGLGNLKSKGWKPLRTIKLISWEGEGYGRIGSTEYMEDYAANLKKNALVYIDLDTAVSGSEFHCTSNKLLEDAIIKAAKSTNYKGNEEWTLYDEWKSYSSEGQDSLCEDATPSIFQSHLGITSASLQFRNNKKTDAVYHPNSMFDSHEWMEKLVDPSSKLHTTLASFSGLLTLMLAEKELHFFTIHPYMKQVYKIMVELNNETTKIFPHDGELRHLSETVQALIGLITSHDSVLFDINTEKIYKDCFTDMPIWFGFKKLSLFMSLEKMNKKLRNFDKLFLTQSGLFDREWMKHTLLAPNKYDGITGVILPGLQEALIEMDRQRVYNELTILQEQFQNVRKLLH